MRRYLPVLLVLLPATTIGLAGCADDPLDEEQGASEDALRKLPPTSILGSIAYGETKEQTIATSSYRGWRLTGSAGDDVTAKVNVSQARLAGVWLVDAGFKNVAAAFPMPGATELSVSAKLPTSGTYYIVFRHTSSKPIVNRVSLEASAAAPAVGLSPAADMSVGSDGFARVTFPGRAGDRFRVMLMVGQGWNYSPPSIALEGCASKPLSAASSTYAFNDVTVTSTATCRIEARHGFRVAVMRLDDPERATYVKSLECDGPELPIESLAAAMPEGATWMGIRARHDLRGRRRSCDPATGCSPYESVATGEYRYYLETSDTGLRLRALDEQHYAYELKTGSPYPYGRDGQKVRARVAPGCLSLTSDAPDAQGVDHVVRFDLPDAPRTPDLPPALAPECGGAPLSDAAVHQLFAPGSSTRHVATFVTAANRQCNRLTGCRP